MGHLTTVFWWAASWVLTSIPAWRDTLRSGTPSTLSTITKSATTKKPRYSRNRYFKPYALSKFYSFYITLMLNL
ncbi:hypothetical protein EJ02DRAFT_422865 [Clathrospora elynae]|uniref:Secreted protein n=1 Tax=Clathrospora elynae TaxID=706981 RepID=A0A6A5SM32_9PLEO|nr:hypothetical protein EJ02DRAFT_422865 [Clathrospora elynae]